MSRLSEEQNQKLKDERREQILDAAIKVFARKGLAATKISDVAAAARLSYGLVYHYFGSKEGIFTALVERAMRGTVEFTSALVEADGPAWPRLQQLVEGMLQGIIENPEYPLIIVQVFVNEDVPAEAKEILQHYSALEAKNIRRLIEQGQLEGSVVAGNPAQLVLTLTALIQGLSISRLQSVVEANQTFPRVEAVMRFLRA
jgi:AcrR family transcriptional regulator